MSLLRVRDLSIDFRTSTKIIHAVRGVSFDVAAGERVGLVGESGSGKTTTALALMRMIKSPGQVTGGTAHLAHRAEKWIRSSAPNDALFRTVSIGSIPKVESTFGSDALGDMDLLALDPRQIRDARLRHVSYVPQGAMNALNPVLRIREQILDGLIDHGVALSARDGDAIVEDVLASVELPRTVADLFPHQLSGGMKQRACIAIAIALKPRLIIADEPTSALDVVTQRHVMKTLCGVQEEIGCGLIMIGHDMGLMAQVVDRVIVMQDGIIVEDAPVGELFGRPKHPYSRMLIESVPSLANRTERRPPLRRVSKAPQDSLLAFKDVQKTFGGGVFSGPAKTALQPCSFQLAGDRPQIISVVGQSGSGKTTMARMILGLEHPSSGTVLYRNTPLGALSGEEARRYRREVQAIFQDPYGSFNPFYKVDRTLAQPLVQFGLAGDRRAIYARMEEACAAVGLRASEILGRFPHELSGGQRQRLMVARALLLRPRLLVADEPVSMVDASLRMTILGNMQSLKNEHNISIIYITHDLATAYHVSDYVLVLHEGRIVEAGAPEDVIERPEHPYTRTLVTAIPWPDPTRQWADLRPDMRADWDAASVVRSQLDGFRLGAAA